MIRFVLLRSLSLAPSSSNRNSFDQQILRKQENYLLFKDEIPLEYQKRYKRKMPSDWFDKLSSESRSFKIERHGSGNLVSIRLL